jgi:TonB family protein
MKLIAVLVAAASLMAAQETIYTPGDGVSLPKVVKQVKAVYTQEAKDAHIEGTVGLSSVVLSDGSVGDVKVTRSLDTTYGLDDQAVAAMKQWTFEPGTKDGKPVAVRVSVNLTFTLK